MAQGRNNNRQRNQAYRGSSYYSYGNVAYELEPKYTPMPVYDEEEERRKKEQIREEKIARREEKVASFKMIMVSAVVFVCSMVFMASTVAVSNANYQLRQDRAALAEIREMNAILEAEAAEQVDLDYIRGEATARLGMAEPQSYQIVYIDVPKLSYTVQYAADELEVAESKSVFSLLSNLWKGNE